MVKVRLMATLKERVGKEEISIDANTLNELAKKLAIIIPDVVDSNGNPSPLYLYVINGTDSRVLGENPTLEKESEVAIIPVNHGG